MNNLEKYIYETLGIEPKTRPLRKGKLEALPLYLRSIYEFEISQIFNRRIIFLIKKEKKHFTTKQYRKHTELVEKEFHLTAVLILEPIEAYNRKRLIQKQVAFIIPGKYMYIPQLFIDLRELRNIKYIKREKFQPAAQCLLLYHLLKDGIEGMNFKSLSQKLGYTPMTITRTVNELVDKNIIHVRGSKNKNIIFNEEKQGVWETALPYMQNPIEKQVYVEGNIDLQLIYNTAYAALAKYTDMASDAKEYFAVSRSDFRFLCEKGMLREISDTEGSIYLEIWKYAPRILADYHTVDPLSLYLTFRNNMNERIEYEFERLLEKLW